jgi:hypothetical protein
MIQSVLSSARVRSGDPPTYLLKVCGDGGFPSNEEIHKKRRERELGKEPIGNVPDRKKRKHNEDFACIIVRIQSRTAT